MSQDNQPQGDKLLWAAGGGVVVMGLAFVGLMFMGGDPDPINELPELTQEAAPAATTPSEAATPAAPSTEDFSVRLTRARLARDAGMLIEPEGYSAWSIYQSILAEDPGNSDAQDGIAAIADDVSESARAALSAGRSDEAQSLAEAILAAVPDHGGARDVIDRIQTAAAAAARPVEAPVAELPEPVAAVVAAPEPEPEPEPARVDPMAEAYSAFTRALAEERLLDTDQDSAASYLQELRTADAAHAMTRDAEEQLFEALLRKHGEAFGSLDTDTALIYLDAAATLGVSPQRVAAARNEVLDFDAEQSAQVSVPASDLTLRNYVAPSYPDSALRRGVEGWVDVSFIVSRDGRPTSVEAVDESNSVFRNAATRAVEAWEFEPHTIHDRVVEQHAQTRIRFVLQ